jgi:charged multivesicular body protein 4
MSGWMSYFTGKPKDSRQSARDSIVGLHSQLLVLNKREEFLQKKIEDELKKAKTNATSNKRRKPMLPIYLPAAILGCWIDPHC